MKKYQAQFLKICETGNLCFLLVPFNRKGYFIEAYLTPNLLPDGMKVEDYAIVELSKNIKIRKTVISKANVIFNPYPNMDYFIKEDPFENLDISFFNED